MGLPVPSARELTDGSTSASELAERGGLNRAVKSAREVSDTYAEFIEEMKKATIAGLTGETQWDTSATDRAYIGNQQVAPIRHETARSANVRKAMDDYEMAKSAGTASSWGEFEKEWSLTNPVSTGLVPYDLEAPAKLLTPRPTPLRNSIPRVKGQGGVRRFKVISGYVFPTRSAA